MRADGRAESDRVSDGFAGPLGLVVSEHSHLESFRFVDVPFNLTVSNNDLPADGGVFERGPGASVF